MLSSDTINCINTDLQEERFSLIFPYISSTPFYHRKIENEGININSIRSLADLSRIPFTYKYELRNSSPFERTPLKKEEIYAIYSSGGTSGNATLYVWSEEDVAVQKDVAQRLFCNLGVNSADIALIIAPLSLPVMGHCMIRQYEAAGAAFIPLGPADPDAVALFIQQLPITLVATLPVIASRLYEYIHYSKNSELSEKTQIRQFHVAGDYLSNARRTRIQNYWNASCYDCYGISEIFGPVAGECIFQNGLHFADEYVYLEVLDPITKLPVPDGEQGVAVYTTLWKKGFPLLRYWSDDFITRNSYTCECGLTSSRIIYHGRPLDCIQTSNRIIFAKDVEEIVLKFPINDEYFIRYNNGYVEAEVEPMPECTVLESEMADALSELLRLRVKIRLNHPGSLPRNEIKPKRLINFPKN